MNCISQKFKKLNSIKDLMPHNQENNHRAVGSVKLFKQSLTMPAAKKLLN